MSRRGRGEGTIHHRASDGRWVAALRPGPGLRRRWYYGSTRDEVRRKLDRARQELERGVLSNRPPRLAAFVDDWLATAQATGRIRTKTIKRYRELLQLHALPDLGKVALDKLTVAAVQEVLNRKSREVAPQTVAHIRAVLRAVLNSAIRREIISRNVAALAEVPAVNAAERGFLTVTQAKTFLAAVSPHRLEVIYSVGIGLGMRPAEVLGLRWEDVDLEAARLQVRMQMLDTYPPKLAPLKTRASARTIDLPAATVRALQRQRARQAAERLARKEWADSGLVVTDEAGKPLHQAVVRKHFYSTLRAAGLPRIWLYDATRHSCASFLVSQGVHPKIAQKVLGHAQFSTTMNVYSHVAPESLKEAADAIDRVLT